MTKFNLKKLVKNQSRGYCTKCGNYLGFIENYVMFCYHCKGYIQLEITNCLEKCDENLDNLRLKFREGIINGDPERYLRVFLAYGEKSLRSNKNHIFPKMSVPLDSTLAEWDAYEFVLINLGLKWILEDLNYSYNKINNFSQEIINIPEQWIILNFEKTNLENDLGVYIKDKNDNAYFYYFQKWIFYSDSLTQHGIINPDTVEINEYNELARKMLEKEIDVNYMIKFVRNDFPNLFLSTLYFIYPDRKEKMFSFNDVFNVSKSEFQKSFPEVYSITQILNYYPIQRNKFEQGLNKEFFFVSKTYLELKREVPDLSWEDKLLPYLIISSKSNPTSFPLLINFDDEILISPSRLEIAVLLMYEKINHKKIHKLLSNEFEIEFQNRVLVSLKNLGFRVEGQTNNIKWTNLQDKKVNSFELDILALCNDYIFIIECKSKRPSPFFNLKPDRKKRKHQFLHFKKQFQERIKPWLINKLNSHQNTTEIFCYKKDFGPITIKIPKEYQNISSDNIVGLYITQLNETFSPESNIFQLYFKDLEMIFEKHPKDN